MIDKHKKMIVDAKSSMADINEQVQWFQAQLKIQEDKLSALAQAQMEENSENHGKSALGDAWLLC